MAEYRIKYELTSRHPVPYITLLDYFLAEELAKVPDPYKHHLTINVGELQTNHRQQTYVTALGTDGYVTIDSDITLDPTDYILMIVINTTDVGGVLNPKILMQGIGRASLYSRLDQQSNPTLAHRTKAYQSRLRNVTNTIPPHLHFKLPLSLQYDSPLSSQALALVKSNLVTKPHAPGWLCHPDHLVSKINTLKAPAFVVTEVNMETFEATIAWRARSDVDTSQMAINFVLASLEKEVVVLGAVMNLSTRSTSLAAYEQQQTNYG